MIGPNKRADAPILTLIAELNARTRWYGSHLWQVPFAYLGVTGALVFSLAERCPSRFSLGCFTSSIFGFMVLIHLVFIVERERRAVRNLIALETKLGLVEPAKARWWYNLPFLLSVFGASVLYLCLGFKSL